MLSFGSLQSIYFQNALLITLTNSSPITMKREVREADPNKNCIGDIELRIEI